jgi:hypothetical protein
MNFMSDSKAPGAETLIKILNRRLESRYRRIKFVYQELARLNTVLQPGALPASGGAVGVEIRGAAGAAANSVAPLAVPGGSFEDLVFKNIDFSIYKKIEAEEFRLLFDEGLEDYNDDFFEDAFKMSREEVREIIISAYIKIGPFFVCKKSGPLLLSFLRTLQTSLEFAPILTAKDTESPEQYSALIAALNGVVIRHSDGTETKLFVPPAAEHDPALSGTFHPLGKAHTIALI